MRELFHERIVQKKMNNLNGAIRRKVSRRKVMFTPHAMFETRSWLVSVTSVKL